MTVAVSNWFRPEDTTFATQQGRVRYAADRAKRQDNTRLQTRKADVGTAYRRRLKTKQSVTSSDEPSVEQTVDHFDTAVVTQGTGYSEDHSTPVTGETYNAKLESATRHVNVLTAVCSPAVNDFPHNKKSRNNIKCKKRKLKKRKRNVPNDNKDVPNVRSAVW